MLTGRLYGMAFLAVLLVPVGLLGASASWRQDRPRTTAEFARDIQPVLKAHCFQCHGGTQRQGGLSLDSRAAALRGGESGRALVPGSAGESPLIARLSGVGGKPRMPLGFAPLSEKQIGLIRDWIDRGAQWPEGGSAGRHWAYIKPVRPPIPKVGNGRWIRNPIDAFVLARLEQAKLQPSPEADKITLLRRVTLDLTGLPPTPQEVDAFLADRTQDAYQKVVTRLLNSPHYGERMALPWLDAARYADSNGFQQDGDTYQYVWRDWVVRALNANMPFDQFTVQQLAGDLLPDATLDQKLATAFNRCHMLNGEGGAIPEEQRNIILFDRVDVASTVWLGATMACAQCHDHKYDPLTQRDYYAFLAFFNNVPESGTPPGGGQYRIAEPWISVSSEEESAKLKALEARVAAAKARTESYARERRAEIEAAQTEWEAATRKQAETGLPEKILAIVKMRPESRSESAAREIRDYFLANQPPAALREAREQLKSAEKERDEHRNSLPRVMILSDARPRTTHILERGNYEMPGAEVQADTPACLPPLPAGAPRNRLTLARWLVGPDHPLTARVQVNRYWQLFFGRGLVRTSENLGTQCEPPTHPELLDWLAVEFRESGWDVKRLHQLIVMSSTYRQSSKTSRALRQRDPENRLLARGARFRLPAMLLRDVALAASGLLDRRLGGKPVYPYQPPGIWDGLAITKERDFTYPQSRGTDLYRRSIYTFWRRTVAPANMFDASVRNTCKVQLSTTSTPLHALTTLNDVQWVEAGRALAERVLKEASADPDARLVDAFRRVCARPPAPDELRVLRRSLDRARAAFHSSPSDAVAYLKSGESIRDARLDPAEHAAYAGVCLALFNLDEALTRE